jgi:hypothetical protein
VGTHLEDVTTLAGKTVTLSWYAKHNSNASLRVAVAQDFDTTNGGSASVLAMDATFSYTTSWNRYSTTFTMPSVAGKTIATDNFIYIAFYNLSANNSILDITGVQLEEGSVATPFRRNSPSIQAELAACQRYFYNSGLSYSGYGFKYYGGGGNALNDSGYFPSVMRITPSVTVSGTITYTNCSALAYSINNTNFVGRVTVTAAGSYRAIGYNLLFDADY